jgi:hypothetical protein
MERTIDLEADLNSQDDEGLGWSVLLDARDPDSVVPGATLVAGNEMATAIVRVVAVDHDGQVHFLILPGSVDENTRLLLGDPG